MNRQYLKLAMWLGLALISSAANALDPIASIPQFEKSMETCLKADKSSSTCLTILIKKHHQQGESNATEIESLINLVKQWLGDEHVLALHLVKSSDFGTVIFRRIYLIEDSAGRLMIANITYQKTQGFLHLRDVQFTNKTENFDQLFENEF